MRKSIATALLLVFLFNLVGYYGLYLGLRAQSNQRLKERLDQNDYSEEETMTIKVPLAIPYQSDWNDFQRVDGEFEKDNQFYNLVAQKLERDTLTFIVIKDHNKASLFEKFIAFVHTTTDTPGKTGKIFSNVSKDFLGTVSRLCPGNAGWTVTKSFTLAIYPLTDRPVDVSYPPPKV